MPLPYWPRRALRLIIPSFALLTLALTAGCGSGQAKVSGRVLLDGKPLPGGWLTFRPAPGKQRSVAVMIDETGHYEVTLPPGEVHIAVDNSELAPPSKESPSAVGFPDLKLPPDMKAKIKAAQKESASAPERERLPGKYVPISSRYYNTETSGLVYDVQSGSQEYDIKLTKKKK
jgi:hypothetical protein